MDEAQGQGAHEVFPLTEEVVNLTFAKDEDRARVSEGAHQGGERAEHLVPQQGQGRLVFRRERRVKRERIRSRIQRGCDGVLIANVRKNLELKNDRSMVKVLHVDQSAAHVTKRLDAIFQNQEAALERGAGNPLRLAPSRRGIRPPPERVAVALLLSTGVIELREALVSGAVRVLSVAFVSVGRP
eukprot:scaffold8593_cov248-Pinguiococcus_pyrenoidosus.AAC.3